MVNISDAVRLQEQRGGESVPDSMTMLAQRCTMVGMLEDGWVVQTTVAQRWINCY